jgi:hypothetical protein
MCDLYQRSRHHADLTLRTSGGLPTMFRENHSKRCGSAVATSSMRHLQVGVSGRGYIVWTQRLMFVLEQG